MAQHRQLGGRMPLGGVGGDSRVGWKRGGLRGFGQLPPSDSQAGAPACFSRALPKSHPVGRGLSRSSGGVITSTPPSLA